MSVISTIHDPILHIDYRNYINEFFLRDAVHRADGWVVHSQGFKAGFTQPILHEFRPNTRSSFGHS